MTSQERYSRQNQVAGYARHTQQRLSAARVLIVGAGGLGGPVAAALVGAGAGRVTIVDHDSVALSNLHRQWFFSEAQLGQSKALQLADHLSALNTEVSVIPLVARLAPDNAPKLVGEHDLIIDAADNFPTSYLLSELCLTDQKPLVTASVNQVYGYVGLLCGRAGPSLRAVFPRIPKQQTSCDVVGVVGPAVATVAGLQAQIALDALTGARDRHGWMHYLDLGEVSLRSIDCRQAKEPTTPRISLITGQQIQSEDWVVDVREPDEVADIAQSFKVHQHSPLSGFETEQLAARSERLVLSCRSGQRALIAAQHAIDAGQTKLAVVIPGNNN